MLDLFYTAEKTLVDRAVVEEDELLDTKLREHSVRNWSKEQQQKLEEGLRLRAGRALGPEEYDEIAMNVVGKTGVECFDRYNYLVALQKKNRPPAPQTPAAAPSSRTSGLTGLFSSLFASVASSSSAAAAPPPPVFQEPLERASSVAAVAVFSSVAPIIFTQQETTLSELKASLLLGVPVLLGNCQVSVEAVVRSMLTGRESIDDTSQHFVSLPATASARDVLLKFANENVLHVHIQAIDDATRVARSISRSEALRFVRSVQGDVNVTAAANPSISLFQEELLVSALRILTLTPNTVVCGERTISWELVEQAGIQKTLDGLKQPLQQFLVATGTPEPSCKVVLKSLMLNNEK